MISLSKRKTMDDRKKQIAESIADACVSSFIESTFPGCTISNLKVRVTMNGDESSATYETNPSRPKLEDGVKPPHVLTKEIAELEPEWRWKDVADARRNRFARWRKTWRRICRYACW